MSRRRCGVLGSPIAHSLSPVLHRAGYDATGLDWEYDAHEVAAGGLTAFLDGLDGTWRGLSLTMPLKREALDAPGVRDVSDVARAAGAANTLVRHDDGGWAADNTDVPGMVAALRERTAAPVASATVLGGGATASSALLALAAAGCREVVLAVRNPDRLRETLEVAARCPGLGVATQALGGPVRGDVLVSTVPAAAQTPEVLAACAGVPVVFDVVYDPWPTPLAAAVTADPDRVLVSGLDLLVHQAALQFTVFTGLPAPLARMRAAGEAALAARHGPDPDPTP